MNLRHQTVSASRNHGLTLSTSCSGDMLARVSRYPRAMMKTSQVVILVRTKAALVIWCGIFGSSDVQQRTNDEVDWLQGSSSKE
jgi:hypothetical protein